MADARNYILLIVAVLSNIYVVLRIVWPYDPQGELRERRRTSYCNSRNLRQKLSSNKLFKFYSNFIQNRKKSDGLPTAYRYSLSIGDTCMT